MSRLGGLLLVVLVAFACDDDGIEKNAGEGLDTGGGDGDVDGDVDGDSDSDGDSDGDPDGDPDILGTWVGHEVGDDTTVWTMEYGEATARIVASGNEVYSGSYTTDTDADPKHLTVMIEQSSFPGYVGESAKAIYKIEDDTLTFAGNEPGVKDRPTTFTPGDGTRVFELTKK